MANSDFMDNFKIILAIVALIAIVFVTNVYMPNKAYFLEGGFEMDIIKFILSILATIATIVILYFSIRKYIEYRSTKYHKKIAKRVQADKLHKKFENLINQDHSNSSTQMITKAWKGIESFVATLPLEMKEEHAKRAKIFHKKLNKYFNAAVEREQEVRNQKRKEEEREQKEQRIFEEQVKALFEFKKKNKSQDVLPLDKKYSDDVINKAESEAHYYFIEEKRKRGIKKDALDYYKMNNLDTKPNIHEEEEEIYLQVRQDILDGKIIPNQTTICAATRTLPHNFYRAKNMPSEMKARADAEGFSYVRGNELDGFVAAGGFYVMKEMQKESNKHFVTKHLFAELHPNMKVEYAKEGKRADVAYISRKFKLAIEVETGTNKLEHIAIKIKWLNKHFDYWFFVCSRKHLSKYNKYVDGKKSFCLPPKRAKEKVLELILQ